MPRYFFHVSGPSAFHDQTGVELADDDAAWSAAVTSCGELLRDLDGKLPDHAQIVVTVMSEAGRPIAALRFMGERGTLDMADGARSRVAASVDLALDWVRDTYAPVDYNDYAEDIATAALVALDAGDMIGRGLVVRKDGAG